MGRFNLVVSNRMERLADRLAESLLPPLSDPLSSETVIVQNRSMERWISMQLSVRNGISANVRFLFPRVFLHEIAARLTGIPPAGDYDPDLLTWRILDMLPGCLEDPLYGDLKRYVADDPATLKRYQLASAIAAAFDRYQIFRPDIVEGWENGAVSSGTASWQADLWRRIRAVCQTEPLNGLRSRIIERLPTASAASALPERVSIFGISHLPTFYLDFFTRLSQATVVNGFFMNPCREFWTDIRSEREMGRIVERVRERTAWKSVTAEQLYLEKGNGLLASLGKVGRDFFAGFAAFPSDAVEDFLDPEETSLLGRIQSDILNLRERGGDGTPKAELDRGDRSVQIHSCHGPLREIEVLHDQLLELFSRRPDLLPKDIVVMAPDIEIYAPLIEAVFAPAAQTADPEKRRREIPYAVSDRGIRNESAIARTFLEILALGKGRFGVQGPLSLLDVPAVRRRFGLVEGDVETIRRWVDESGIRWGVDAQDRVREGLPPVIENTWRSGLDRLLLGYAMAGDGRRIFRGVVPYDDIEGKEAELLGRFVDFAETLFSLRGSLGGARSLSGWADALSEVLETFFSPVGEEEEEDLRRMRRSIEEIHGRGTKAVFRGSVEFPVATSLLAHLLGKGSHPYGYMTGGVTFCAMVPMRSIPSRVVCLLGMNNADYPRHSEPAGFDLLAEHPRTGDPSRRNDDRYLFLEALLSARELFYISYVGQSSEGNGVIPPSVVVSELLDHLERGYRCEGDTVTASLLTRHPLQPFDPGYFAADPRLFSFCTDHLAAARILVDPVKVERSFATAPLGEPQPGWREISNGDLIAFFMNPSKYLLQRRVGLSFPIEGEPLAERELFRIGGWERYHLGEEALEQALAGRDPRELFAAMMSAGKLPHGALGSCEYETLCREVNLLAETVRPLLRGGPVTPPAIDLDIAGFHLTGSIGAVGDSGLVRYRYGTLRGRDRLRLWIDFLLWLATEPEEGRREATLAGREQRILFRGPESPRQTLEELLRLYARGQRTPMAFFPESSWAYAEALHRGKGGAAEALRKAGSAWTGSEQFPGEGEDPFYRLCFGTEPPLDTEFEEAAVAVFEPLLGCLERLER